MSIRSLTSFSFLLTLIFVNQSICQTTSIPSSYELNLTTFASHTEFEAGGGSNPQGTLSGFGPIKITAPRDGSGRVFVSSQTGKILVFDADGTSLGTFLDLNTISSATGYTLGGPGSFRGLMYFDFHPDYNLIGAPGYKKLYVGYRVSTSYGNSGANANYRIQDYHSRSGSNQYAIAEFTVSVSDANKVDHSTFREVFRIQTEGSNPHGLGEIAFNPNSVSGDSDYGLLYAAIGDGSALGNGAPATGYLQKLENPFGKIICINPLQNGADAYSIPTTNPYYGQIGVAQEIYAIGFRDPQTFSFAHDTEGNDILITFDIGAAQREEIIIVRPGGNYGWERYEGTRLNNSNVSLVQGTVHSPPVVEYDHTTGGFAIVGGFVVSDPQDVNFKDKVIFTDLPTGKVFFADFNEMLQAEKDGNQASFYEINNFKLDGVEITENIGGGGTNPGVTFEDVIRYQRGDLRFGHDEQGNVYFVTKQSGTIFKTELVYKRTDGNTVSVEDIANHNDVIFYQNPSDDLLFVKMSSNKNNMPYNLMMYNSLGSEILNRKGNGDSSSISPIDVSGFMAGIYFVKFTLDKVTHYKKIIIQ
ncbi:PQQ-dependent sugar dehydrogenase [Flavivirga abyssicola]|uniref:PQQ-dependent sugar dehydrogenase n=1 Tax=Flavivirga abyssicola TaxID=3063533 RepID=UPI0026DF492F|nr:PQQ-dependent sugar dehydrogenase [Flavivirga sp. MEBiC07777]WVK11929.1 PQQ-dependent sugar dehydrogenase [Flavivirga sp. MEBiC07777]